MVVMMMAVPQPEAKGRVDDGKRSVCGGLKSVFLCVCVEVVGISIRRREK
jgi:hypothetical protein